MIFRSGLFMGFKTGRAFGSIRPNPASGKARAGSAFFLVGRSPNRRCQVRGLWNLDLFRLPCRLRGFILRAVLRLPCDAFLFEKACSTSAPHIERFPSNRNALQTQLSQGRSSLEAQ